MAIKMEEIFQFHQGLSGFFKARTAKSAGVLSFNSIKDYHYRKEVEYKREILNFQFHQGLS